VSAWWLRVAFIVLALLSSDIFGVLYVLLWWALPQESLAAQRRGGIGGLLVLVLLLAAAVFAWLGHDLGWLRGPSGQDLLVPGLALVTSTIFLLRQVRAA
jgi:hypothetical protein